MTTKAVARPSWREVLKGYKRFNTWELAQQKEELSQLSVEESLTQFFELCALGRRLAPGAERIFLEQNRAYWITRRGEPDPVFRTVRSGAPPRAGRRTDIS